MNTENLAGYLLRKFREWETEKGSRKTVSSWARYLGIKQPTLNRYMNGDSQPEGENLRILARKIGPEIYLILGSPIPLDLAVSVEDLTYIAETIQKVPLHLRDQFRKDLAVIVERYIQAGDGPLGPKPIVYEEGGQITPKSGHHEYIPDDAFDIGKPKVREK